MTKKTNFLLLWIALMSPWILIVYLEMTAKDTSGMVPVENCVMIRNDAQANGGY